MRVDMKHGHKLAGCTAEHPEVARLRSENLALRVHLGHVEMLHTPVWVEGNPCGECGQEWPCPTARAADHR